MKTFIRKCLAMGFIAAFVLFHSNPAHAATAVEAELVVLAGKLSKLDAAIASGKCTTCASSLEAIKADLQKLSGPKADELKKQVADLDAKLDAAPKATAAEVVAQLSAKYGPLWEEAARKPSNVCSTYVDALKGAGADAQVLKALADAIGECAKQGAVAVDMAKVVCQNGGVIKTATTTIVCDAPPPPKVELFPKKALGPKVAADEFGDPLPMPPPPPPAPSNRTFAGWALSGLGGAVVFGATGWWLGNKAGPVKVTDSGVDSGMGAPVAVLGGLVGGLVGAGIYALATDEK